jgi:uncharacterized protein
LTVPGCAAEDAAVAARIDVEVPSTGAALAGWLYLPAVVPAPAVVLGHGFSATREMGLTVFAEAFVAEGWIALVIDHAGFGASTGEPRQQVNGIRQARGYLDAVSWLSARPEVDPARIALWGSSMAGGVVTVAAACDDRVRAVVAQVPAAGPAVVDDPDGRRFAALRATILHGDPATWTSPAFGPIAVTSVDPEVPAILHDPVAHAFFAAVGGPGTGWVNEVTIATPDVPEPYDPGLAAAHVAPAALLMVVAEGDELVGATIDVARAQFARASEPKELVVLPCGHFDVYDGPSLVESIAVQVDFLRRHLAGRADPPDPSDLTPGG